MLLDLSTSAVVWVQVMTKLLAYQIASILCPNLLLQQSALKVDEAVLSVKPGEASSTATATAIKSGTAMARTAAAGAARTAGSTYSHSWKQQTDMLLQEAQHLAADAARCVLLQMVLLQMVLM
jgi:hypothetical protein